MRRIALVLGILVTAHAPVFAQEPVVSTAAPSDAGAPLAPALSLAEKERFLLSATLDRVRGVREGITGTQRATLVDGALHHDASVQTIDESKSRFESTSRIEFNFRDYWGYNVAAYRLAVLLGLDNVPPSVQRIHRGRESSYTWWVDNVLMDEKGRSKQKRHPPDSIYWSGQMQIMRVFDELIANTDRNQGNMLIDADWKLWLIDHSRAFRTGRNIRRPGNVRRCERTLLERMKGLTRAAMDAQLDRYLSPYEIEAILARRDLLVAHFESLGPAALYDLRPPEPSGRRLTAR